MPVVLNSSLTDAKHCKLSEHFEHYERCAQWTKWTKRRSRRHKSVIGTNTAALLLLFATLCHPIAQLIRAQTRLEERVITDHWPALYLWDAAFYSLNANPTQHWLTMVQIIRYRRQNNKVFVSSLALFLTSFWRFRCNLVPLSYWSELNELISVRIKSIILRLQRYFTFHVMPLYSTQPILSHSQAIQAMSLSFVYWVSLWRRVALKTSNAWSAQI